MNLRNQITQISTAVFFLLAILWQPAHQLEHLSHSPENSFAEQTGISFQNQYETHCNLCDFMFFPVVESSAGQIEFPPEFVFIPPKQESVCSNHYNSKLQSHKQLRAPPYA